MTKLIAFIMTLALLVGAAVGTALTVSAAESEGAKIGSVNVEYNDLMHLAVSVTDYTPESGKALGLRVYKGEELVYETYNLKTTKDDEGNEIKYFTTDGVAAREIFDVKTYKLCVKSGDEVTVLDTIDYCVAQYAIQNVNKTTDVDRANLYSITLEYGKFAYKVLSKADVAPTTFAFVEVDGGTVGAAKVATYGGAIGGGSITLTANATDANGNAFSHWVCNGETVADTAEATVTPAVGYSVYTAVYGE